MDTKKYIIELERGETAYKTVDLNGAPLIQLLALSPYTESDTEGGRSMSRLDDIIASVAYIFDTLIVYRNIVEAGDCNICKNKDCQWKPKSGQIVRYNCPHYKAEDEA